MLGLALAAAGCGDNKSPSAPSSPSGPSQAAGGLSITEVSVSAYGAPGDITYNLTMRLTETSGQVPITLTTLGMSLDNSGTATSPLSGGEARLGAGGSQKLSSISFSDKSGRPAASKMSLTLGFRDDNSRTGSATASADVQKLAMVTLSGVVTDRSNGRPIANAEIYVQSSGLNESKRTRSDANGAYALGPLVAGAFRVFYVGSDHAGQSHQIDIATDATWNVALAPEVEYRITGSARTCSVTYENAAGGTSQARLTIPWSYSRGASPSDFLYVSCQIDSGGDSGSISVNIYRNGDLFKFASASGFPNIATASGSY